MEINNFTDNIIGETGIVDNLSSNSQTIFLDNNYDNPVIFAQPLSYNNAQAAIVRIEDIQSDRFTAFVQEPSNLNGYHPNESFSYLVLEKGTWQLEDDTLLEVGTVDTNRLSSSGWDNINFANNFADDPLVFSQVQTDNGQDFVNTRQKNTSNSGFQITMEEEEAFNNSGHATETLGWFAIDAGKGNWSQNSYRAGHTGDRIGHQWKNINFNNNFSEPPVFLASTATFNGSDPATLRYSNLSNDQVKIKLQEDTSKDAEIYHAAETVNFLAIAGNNSLRGVPLGEKRLEGNENIIKDSLNQIQPLKLEGEWDVIYDGLNQNQPLNIVGMENVLIRNSTFNNVKGGDAISIRNSDNVHIENVTINNTVNNDAIDIRFSDDVYIDDVVVNKISGKSSLSGVKILQSTNITVEDSEFSRIFSPGHSAGVKIVKNSSNNVTADITINNNYIHNIYGNGIVTAGSHKPGNLYAHENPIPRLKITNNLIHDVGLTPTPVSGSPTHGMYIKAQDAYIANNTVYNSWDGEGISIRSTAIVKNNKIWDTKRAAIAFYQDVPAGSSMRSIIKNNELFFTKNRPTGDNNQPLIKLYWNQEKNILHYDTFGIRDNKLSISQELVGSPPLMGIYYPIDNLFIMGNDFVDNRKRPKFFSANYSIRNQDKNWNSFNEI